ncbi:MAG TPA: PD-(D/E)XK nuclease family protein, partial [Vicinamibacterales bacterium]|nr:PD-(D/E)XK nuclease family protein [Vicinamibacterales bacterium]
LATALEREVAFQAAARAAAAAGIELTFQLRPGLVAEMLRFYDHLRRQMQQVDRFQELIDDALGGVGPGDDGGADRGAERLRRQTMFLAETFREYQRRVASSGACDEHSLRERLIAVAAPSPLRRVVVTLADWIADPDGLFVADFDLLARIPNLETIDLVATESTLASGFHERVREWFPGIEEIRGAGPSPRIVPKILVPAGSDVAQPWWVHRDREEELVAVARQIRADRDMSPGRTAVVFKRPLPYVYLAAEVFGSAGIRYQLFDTTPLAAEPTAAAFDVILDAVASDFTRSALVALLRSPHLIFRTDDNADVARESVAALDRALSDLRYLGSLDRLHEMATQHPRPGAVRSEAVAALLAAAAAARELAALASAAPASQQIARLLAFWSAHARSLAETDPLTGRDRRARAAIVDSLTRLADAHRGQDDPQWTIADLVIAVRRLIEEQTFASTAGTALGVSLVDDRAARYGDFDDVAIVGVVDSDWPERPHRNIFYPSRILKSLGWPSEADRRRGADARFLDLLSSASRRTSVSTFTLDDDALVMRSLQLDQIPSLKMSTVPAEADPATDADWSADADMPFTDAAEARAWDRLRTSRTPADRSDFHGSIGLQPARPWAVSALETYGSCPFKFFAQHVLRLEEEPDDEEVMDPRRQGRFVHEVFEEFFRQWKASGRRAVTPGNLDDARALFATVVESALERLPASEAGLDRTRLLGSPAAAGLGDAVLRMEAERPVEVVDRLLEHRLDGPFRFSTAAGERTIALKGKADRIDLLADGTLRLIDYKLGWPPDRSTALQLPIYSLCAEQQLASRRPEPGRQWTLAEAAYIAFKGPRRVVPLYDPSRTGSRESTFADAQRRLVDTVDAIGRGEFPPTPDDVFRCETCTFAPVCRKDYVGDV